MTIAEYERKFARCFGDYLNQLAQLGEMTASDGFANNGYVGESNVSVNTERQNAGFTIRAAGESVSFIEFGTGVATHVSRPTVQAPYPIAVGSWSDAHEGEFFRTGHQFWHYKGERLEGTPPAAGMQNACIAMEQQSPIIARRAFG